MAIRPNREPDALVSPEVMQQVEQYLQRPYRIVIRGDAEEGYLAEVPDLPGCMTAGETPAEALANVPEAMTAWLVAVIERGLPVPEPASAGPAEQEGAYNGRVLLRLPKYLHRGLALRARQEGVSLNTLLLTYLAYAYARPPAGTGLPPATSA